MHNHVRHVAMIVVSVFDNIHIELCGVQISSTNKQTSLPVLAQYRRNRMLNAFANINELVHVDGAFAYLYFFIFNLYSN